MPGPETLASPLMLPHFPDNVVDLPGLRNRSRVFRDRSHAGEVLARMLASYRRSAACVFAIPAGGIPVASVVANALELPLEIAVVSKITLPWNTEAGYGAVAFDGSVALNDGLLARIGLNEEEIQKGIAATRLKVKRRVERFVCEHSPRVAGSTPVILVDDGLASGFSLSVAVEALSRCAVQSLVVAVPTGHGETVRRLAERVTALHCANIREGFSFAVADAFESWADVSEDEALALFQQASATAPKTSRN